MKFICLPFPWYKKIIDSASLQGRVNIYLGVKQWSINKGNRQKNCI